MQAQEHDKAPGLNGHSRIGRKFTAEQRRHLKKVLRESGGDRVALLEAMRALRPAAQMNHVSNFVRLHAPAFRLFVKGVKTRKAPPPDREARREGDVAAHGRGDRRQGGLHHGHRDRAGRSRAAGGGLT